MNRETRLAKLEELTEPNPMRVVWSDEGEDASAKITAMIRDGRAKADDRFLIVGWRHAA